MNGSELPPDAMDPAPPGTPPAQRVAKHLAPVKCAHGTRWAYVAGKGLYVADDALAGEHLGHDIGAREPGAIDCWDGQPWHDEDEEGS